MLAAGKSEVIVVRSLPAENTIWSSLFWRRASPPLAGDVGVENVWDVRKRTLIF
jgi:hypothetical protein